MADARDRQRHFLRDARQSSGGASNLKTSDPAVDKPSTRDVASTLPYNFDPRKLKMATRIGGKYGLEDVLGAYPCYLTFGGTSWCLYFD